MNFEELILLIDATVFRHHQQHLRDIDVLVLRESLHQKSYDKIAETHGYTGQYLRQDVGPKLWQTLSSALEIKISKKNCAAVLENFWQQRQKLQSRVDGRSQPQIPIPPASPSQATPSQNTAKIDWGSCFTPAFFCGRDAELEQLQRWILQDSIRMVAVTGMGGIGKTALVHQLINRLQSDFDFILTRSLLNCPPLQNILTPLFDLVGEDIAATGIEEITHESLRLLQTHRCLLMFDDLEIGSSGNEEVCSTNAPNYHHLFQYFAGQAHQSCIIVTSRQRDSLWDERHDFSRIFPLKGLTLQDARLIMHDKGLQALDLASLEIILRHYQGNPLALKIVAAGVRDLGQGELSSVIPFIEQGILPFTDLDDLLARQFQRLDGIEQQVIYWLAIHREPLSLAQLNQYILRFNIIKQLPRAVQALSRRSLIERNERGLYLQPVVMAYVMRRFLENLTAEVTHGQYILFQTYALLHAQAKDSIRQAQQKFVLQPFLMALVQHFGSEARVRDHFLTLLERLRIETPCQPSYACGNILNLLRLLDGNLNHLDCSHLVVWQADLVGLSIEQTNFCQADLSRSVLSQALGTALSVCFSPDGQCFATASADDDIRVWGFRDCKQLRRYRGHGHWGSTVAFCPENQTLVSGSFDKTIKLWDLETGQCLNTLEGHTGWIWAVSCSLDEQILASCGDDHTIRIWDRQTGACLQVLEHPEASVCALAFSPNGECLAAVNGTAVVTIWDWRTGHSRDLMPPIREHNIQSLAFSPDGQSVATGSSSGETEVWDFATGECLHRLQGHSQAVMRVVFVPPMAGAPRRLVSGSQDGTLKLWDLETGRLARTLRGHLNGILDVAVHPNQPFLLSSSNDGAIKLWDMATGEAIRTLQGYSFGVKAIALSPDGQQLASGGDDRQIHLWDMQTRRQHQSVSGHSTCIWALAYGVDGTRLLSAGNDHQIKHWDLQTGQVIQTYTGHQSLIFSLAVHDSAELIASASYDQTMRLWNVQTGECLHTLTHPGRVWSVAFSPDGDCLAYGHGDAGVNLWDVRSHELLYQFEGHTSLVWDLAFSPDGRWLASGSDDRTARIWDLTARTCLQTLTGHTGEVWAIAFSPDGTQIATGSNDRSIKLWSTASGALLQTLYGHESAVWDVTFRGETEVVSASQAGAIKIWDLATGSCVQTLRAHRHYEGMNLREAKGLTDAQKISLTTLGAVF